LNKSKYIKCKQVLVNKFCCACAIFLFYGLFLITVFCHLLIWSKLRVSRNDRIRVGGCVTRSRKLVSIKWNHSYDLVVFNSTTSIFNFIGFESLNWHLVCMSVWDFFFFRLLKNKNNLNITIFKWLKKN